MKGLFKDLLKDVWNVPNVLTMLRIALIPVYIVVHSLGHDMAALVIFLCASFTDLLDGYLARRNNQITNFGKLMDPLADKIMIICVLVTQTLRGLIPWPVLCIVSIKELAMIFGGAYMLDKGFVVYSNVLGKLAQFTFVSALVLTFFQESIATWPLPLDQVLLWVATGLTLAALVCYSIAGLKKIKAAK